MTDSTLAAAIKAAVEVQGIAWGGRTRVGTPEQLADGLSNALQHADGMTSREAVAAMIGESAQETDWYCSLVEYGGANAWYAPYYGRGCIQLTHQSNYSAFGAWAQKLGYATSSADMVSNPNKVATMPWAWLACIWYFAANIPASYWTNRNWNAISGLINAGDASYYVPAFELRTRSIIAALNILNRNNWTYEGDGLMAVTQDDLRKIHDAVWHGVSGAKLITNRRLGRGEWAETLLGSNEQRLESLIPNSVWGKTVKRAGLPSDDPRADKEVSVGTIMAYMDSFVLDVKNSIVAAVSSIATETDTEQIIKAVDNAINESVDQYAQLHEQKPRSDGSALLDSAVHVVSSGETLDTIAVEHNTTTAEIIAANPDLDSNLLEVGRKIVVPVTATKQKD
ncbi:chitinase [Propionibacterium ruminifibrarum]|uniref:Chitinase n=1 Tax=Propionibacterium ruminifibrarum TaxID=1962131 RepID=A0A375I2Q7_9ACTN|nr:LysM peptidoglycan-binding domain-containing protein [Propionibacterium ruminifibrarum]SPF69154.1 chitinase [Propionibacterium ruminifibrarum]